MDANATKCLGKKKIRKKGISLMLRPTWLKIVFWGNNFRHVVKKKLEIFGG
jgi:hypothetical protein